MKRVAAFLIFLLCALPALGLSKWERVLTEKQSGSRDLQVMTSAVVYVYEPGATVNSSECSGTTVNVYSSANIEVGDTIEIDGQQGEVQTVPDGTSFTLDDSLTCDEGDRALVVSELATIYSDEGGTTAITQDGTSNVASSTTGRYIFYIDIGTYPQFDIKATRGSSTLILADESEGTLATPTVTPGPLIIQTANPVMDAGGGEFANVSAGVGINLKDEAGNEVFTVVPFSPGDSAANPDVTIVRIGQNAHDIGDAKQGILVSDIYDDLGSSEAQAGYFIPKFTGTGEATTQAITSLAFAGAESGESQGTVIGTNSFGWVTDEGTTGIVIGSASRAQTAPDYTKAPSIGQHWGGYFVSGIRNAATVGPVRGIYVVKPDKYNFSSTEATGDVDGEVFDCSGESGCDFTFDLTDGIMHNLTDDGSTCTITSSTTTSATCSAGLTGGADDQFDIGDSVRIAAPGSILNAVTALLEQPYDGSADTPAVGTNYNFALQLLSPEPSHDITMAFTVPGPLHRTLKWDDSESAFVFNDDLQAKSVEVSESGVTVGRSSGEPYIILKEGSTALAQIRGIEDSDDLVKGLAITSQAGSGTCPGALCNRWLSFGTQGGGDENMKVEKGLLLSRQEVTTASNIEAEKVYIGVDPPGAAVQVNLMTTHCDDTGDIGKTIIIKDEGIEANTYNINLVTQGTEKLEGTDRDVGTPYAMDEDGEALTIICGQVGEWFIIGKYP